MGKERTLIDQVTDIKIDVLFYVLRAWEGIY